jgi:hypothetical protein
MIKSNKVNFINKSLTDLIKGKIIDSVMRVDCDEGFVIIFSDSSELEVGYSDEGSGDESCLYNGKYVDVSGYFEYKE